MNSVTIRSSQKVFTEAEVSSLMGISLDDLRALAQNKHLGFLGRAAKDAGQWLFTNSDLMVLSVLHPHRS